MGGPQAHPLITRTMNNSTKYMIGTLIVLVGVIGISFYSCEKEEIAPNELTIAPIQETDADNTFREEGQSAIRFEMITQREDFLNTDYELILSNEICGKPSDKIITSAQIGQTGKAMIFNSENFLNILIVSQDAYVIESAKLNVRPETEPAINEGSSDRFSVSTPEDRTPSRFVGFKIPLEDVHKVSMISGSVTLNTKDGKRVLSWLQGEDLGTTTNGKQFTYELRDCTVPGGGDVPAPQAGKETDL